MARKEPLPSVTSEADEQIDYSIFLILLGEEGREQFFHYLQVRRERQETKNLTASDRPGA